MELIEWFFPSIGLRQGYLLGPIYFSSVLKGSLSGCKKKKGWMMGTTIGRERLAINHLFFADDCILFGDASYEGAKVVQDIIREYEMVSRQRVNQS